MKKVPLVILFTVLFFFLLLAFFLGGVEKSETHLAIIPHFMLASEKVDAFYSFLKSKRYADHDPNTIIIVSPNHFNPRATTPQTICEPSEVYFKQQSFFLTPFPHITCEENIFYPFGSRFTTNEHGIGEHLPQIATYFPTTTTIIPLALPSHYQPKMENFTLPQTGETLVIASVDFSHYLPEETAQSNDQISIKVIQSGTGKRADFSSLDVDCPACLFSVQQLATLFLQHAQLRYRDSSSTILGHDMKQDNTSRVFMWYE